MTFIRLAAFLEYCALGSSLIVCAMDLGDLNGFQPAPDARPADILALFVDAHLFLAFDGVVLPGPSVRDWIGAVRLLDQHPAVAREVIDPTRLADESRLNLYLFRVGFAHFAHERYEVPNEGPCKELQRLGRALLLRWLALAQVTG